MIGSLHHIGIAVANLEEALHRFATMGFHAGLPEVVTSEGVRLAFVAPQSEDFSVGSKHDGANRHIRRRQGALGFSECKTHPLGM